MDLDEGPPGCLVTSDSAPAVLLCTSNGVGLGHLTRMMAIGDHLRTAGAVTPIIFTLSGAVSIPVQAGFHVEHLASHEYPGLHGGQWHRLLEDRVDELIAIYQPRVVVFDGVHPYRGLVSALEMHRRKVTRVWQRRAMWRPEVGRTALAARRFFDEVIEPGEYADAYDSGVTMADRAGVHLVAPIVYQPATTSDRPSSMSDHPPSIDRAAACQALDLDPADTNVLVQLGAGRINDVGSLTGRAVAALRAAAPERDAAGRRVQIVVARSALSADDLRVDGVRTVSKFPISRWFAAFDGAVLASGYNSFHEAMALKVPSIWVPNLTTRTDDQDARSRWAADQGLGVRSEAADMDDLTQACGRLLDATRRAEMRAGVAALAPACGAPEVAQLVTQWASR